MLRGKALRRGVTVLFAVGMTLFLSAHSTGNNPTSSLLLLIDTSGSMGDPVGGGNSEIKIEAARSAALAAVEQAARKQGVEVAVLAFEGDCSRPVPRYHGFTTDFGALAGFIRSLEPGGGTPMAEAVLVANRFMRNEGAPGARDQMIVLLADGANDCGSIVDALAELRASGVIFRHETVGFGIEPNTTAARDLQQIATASGGAYHHAADATQLGDLFLEFVNTFTLIDMLGTFGGGVGVAPPADERARATNPTTSPPAQERPPGEMSRLVGRIRPGPPASAPDARVPTASRWGALAIDSNQGPSWGWAADYGTVGEASQRALSECGVESCGVVMTFGDQCGAFAADQARGSTVYGWAKGASAVATQDTALEQCRQRGGTSCLVRVWGCNTRP